MTRTRVGPAVGDTVRRRLTELLGSEDPPPDAPPPDAPPSAKPPGTPGSAPPGGPLPGPEPEPSPAAPALRGRAAALTRRALGFGREHLAVVAIIALAGCLWAGVSMTQARSVPVAVTGSPSAVAAAPTSTPPPQVQVHVLGAVKKPGVVRLPQGSRVNDAIAAAGGLAADARPGDLNLAAIVADGSQLVIGTPSDPGGEMRGAGADADGAPAGGGTAGLINLNTATAEQLDTLPGVGPVTAQAILAWRAKHGRFTGVAELQEVDGIGAKTYASLADKLTV